LKELGYSGVLQDNIGVVWDPKAIISEKPKPQIKESKATTIGGAIDANGVTKTLSPLDRVEVRQADLTEKPKDELPIKASPEDIDYQLAYNAHAGSSMVPEERAAQRQQDYFGMLKSAYESVNKLAETDEQKEILKTELARYRVGLIKKYNAWLSAESRTMSSMVTGASNFPTASNRKKLDTAHKRMTEMSEWNTRAIKAMKKAVAPGRFAISADNPEAVDLLQNKIDAAVENQERMKGVNKILRSKLSDEEKIAKVESDHGLKPSTTKALMEPDFAGREGFAGYELTNNNANIRRMKQRLEDLKKKREDVTFEAEGKEATVTDNVEDNRVQLFFDGKPSDEIRKKLKANGFRWAPSVGAWQRQMK